MIQEIWGNTIFVHRAKYIAKNIEKNTIISPNFLVWKFCGKAQFPHSEKHWEKIIIDTINWRKLSPARKNHWKKYWEKINIDAINWEKLFVDPWNTNNAIYLDSVTLVRKINRLVFNFGSENTVELQRHKNACAQQMSHIKQTCLLMIGYERKCFKTSRTYEVKNKRHFFNVSSYTDDKASYVRSGSVDEVMIV